MRRAAWIYDNGWEMQRTTGCTRGYAWRDNKYHEISWMNASIHAAAAKYSRGPDIGQNGSAVVTRSKRRIYREPIIPLTWRTQRKSVELELMYQVDDLW